MNILNLVDLDGTANTIDIHAALEGLGCPEIQYYIQAAAEFVANDTGLPEAVVLQNLKDAILKIYPNRDQYQYWGSFHSTEKQPVKIVPAVDHFTLVYAAVDLLLQDELRKAAPHDPTKGRIQIFLQSEWRPQLFKFSSNASNQYAEIEEDARDALEALLMRDELVAILTNSSTDKAKDMLKKAGFGDRTLLNGVAPGKIGAIGGAMKFLVDTSQPEEGAFVDLSSYFGFAVKLDLRRRSFRRLVRKLAEDTRAQEIRIYSDIPEMDNYPLAAEFGGLARHGMKLNPCSVEGSIRAARELIGAVTSDRLSALVEGMR